jgi:alpha-glucoside transport system permease protein
VSTVAEELPREEETTPQRILRFLARAPVHIILIVVGIFWLIPTLGLFLTSLMDPSQFTEQGWWNIISQPSLATLDNYDEVFNTQAITSALWTTVLISVGGTILPIFVASMAGYAFAWLEFPGRDWLFIAVIAMLVVPIQMALIPIFIGIPKDLMEAARIDGASEIRIFVRLILPLGLPAIASLAIFQFLWTWNDLLVALTFGRETQPITVAIFTQLRQFGSNIELIAPAAFVSLALPLAVFFAFQRYFVQGLLAGSVK